MNHIAEELAEIDRALKTIHERWENMTQSEAEITINSHYNNYRVLLYHYSRNFKTLVENERTKCEEQILQHLGFCLDEIRLLEAKTARRNAERLEEEERRQRTAQLLAEEEEIFRRAEADRAAHERTLNPLLVALEQVFTQATQYSPPTPIEPLTRAVEAWNSTLNPQGHQEWTGTTGVRDIEKRLEMRIPSYIFEVPWKNLVNLVRRRGSELDVRAVREAIALNIAQQGDPPVRRADLEELQAIDAWLNADLHYDAEHLASLVLKEEQEAFTTFLRRKGLITTTLQNEPFDVASRRVRKGIGARSFIGNYLAFKFYCDWAYHPWVAPNITPNLVQETGLAYQTRVCIERWDEVLPVLKRGAFGPHGSLEKQRAFQRLEKAKGEALSLAEEAKTGAYKSIDPMVLEALLEVSRRRPRLLCTKDHLLSIWRALGRPVVDKAQPSSGGPRRASKHGTDDVHAPSVASKVAAQHLVHEVQLLPAIADALWAAASNEDEVVNGFPDNLKRVMDRYAPYVEHGEWHAALGMLASGDISFRDFDANMSIVEESDRGTFSFLINAVFDRRVTRERAAELYSRFNERPAAVRRVLDNNEDIDLVAETPELDGR